MGSNRPRQHKMRKNCSENQTKTTIELSPTHPWDSLLSSSLLLKILFKSLHKNYHRRYNEENREKDAKKRNKGLYFSFKWLKTKGKEKEQKPNISPDKSANSFNSLKLRRSQTEQNHIRRIEE